jgi:hypothetical protein
VPCWGSVAWPEKLIASPTFQVVPATGVSSTAVGGVLPTEIGTESVLLAPEGSVTRSAAV